MTVRKRLGLVAIISGALVALLMLLVACSGGTSATNTASRSSADTSTAAGTTSTTSAAASNDSALEAAVSEDNLDAGPADCLPGKQILMDLQHDPVGGYTFQPNAKGSDYEQGAEQIYMDRLVAWIRANPDTPCVKGMVTFARDKKDQYDVYDADQLADALVATTKVRSVGEANHGKKLTQLNTFFDKNTGELMPLHNAEYSIDTLGFFEMTGSGEFVSDDQGNPVMWFKTACGNGQLPPRTEAAAKQHAITTSTTSTSRRPADTTSATTKKTTTSTTTVTKTKTATPSPSTTTKSTTSTTTATKTVTASPSTTTTETASDSIPPSTTRTTTTVPTTTTAPPPADEIVKTTTSSSTPLPSTTTTTTKPTSCSPGPKPTTPPPSGYRTWVLDKSLDQCGRWVGGDKIHNGQKPECTLDGTGADKGDCVSNGTQQSPQSNNTLQVGNGSTTNTSTTGADSLPDSGDQSAQDGMPSQPA